MYVLPCMLSCGGTQLVIHNTNAGRTCQKDALVLASVWLLKFFDALTGIAIISSTASLFHFS